MHDLGGAVQSNGDDLLCAPVREPEATVVPTRLLPKSDACQEYVWCLHGLILSTYLLALSLCQPPARLSAMICFTIADHRGRRERRR